MWDLGKDSFLLLLLFLLLFLRLPLLLRLSPEGCWSLQHQLLKRLSLIHWLFFLASSWNSSWAYLYECFSGFSILFWSVWAPTNDARSLLRYGAALAGSIASSWVQTVLVRDSPHCTLLCQDSCSSLSFCALYVNFRISFFTSTKNVLFHHSCSALYYLSFYFGFPCFGFIRLFFFHVLR